MAFAGRTLPPAAGEGRWDPALDYAPNPPSIIRKGEKKKASFTDMSDHCCQSPSELLGGHIFF